VTFLSSCSKSDGLQSGTFVDAPVAGLAFATPSFSGTTSAGGAFSYQPGETVVFSVGSIVLGSATGRSVVTPLHLVAGAADVTDQSVTNICVFLQTLDEDGDLNNGIKINNRTAAVVAATAGGLNFNQTPESFAADATIVALLAALNLNNAAGFTSNETGGRVLRSAAEARAHMLATLSARKAVVTALGTVNGYTPDSYTWVWKGIPYAKPPVGSLRWTAPSDPDSWTGVREATAGCSICTQGVRDKFWRQSGAFTGSENCLYLDVYRPKSDVTNLPVYVWMHGGSNNNGSAKDYDGRGLALRGNIVVVVIQYRLGALGWLTHPALREGRGALDASGNYGALDQIKALTWVKNNISAFGGDPAKVTVGGQSAGGHDTMNLVVSPYGQGLFSKAVVHGGALDRIMPLYTRAQADAMTDATIDGLIIRDGLAADAASAAAYRSGLTYAQIEAYLRSKTAEQLLKSRRDGTGSVGSGSMAMHSAIRDGAVIRDATWHEAITAGNYNKIPILIGNNKNEWNDFMPLYGYAVKAYFGLPSGTKSWADLYDVIDGTLALNDVLPTDRDKNFYTTVGSLVSRVWKYYAVDRIARELKTNDAGNVVYAYRFDWAGGGDAAIADYKFIFGAAHAMEVPLFYGNRTDLFGGYSLTTANRSGFESLQGAMMDYLISFIKTGNPNPTGSDLILWPQWDNATGGSKMMTFDAGLAMKALGVSIYEETAAGLTADIMSAAGIYSTSGERGVMSIFSLFTTVD